MHLSEKLKMRVLFYLSSVLTMGIVAAGGVILPDPVAAHFNAAGNANGWMPRSHYLIFMTVLVLIFIILFEGMRRILHRLPAWMVNIPNKDYWLAPERKEETYDFYRAMMDRIGIATMLFLSVITVLAYVANLAKPPALDLGQYVWVLVIFISYVLIETFYSYYRFRRPRESIDQDIPPK